MESRTRFYINGKWVEPSTNRTLNVINPATEQIIDCVAMENQQDVSKVVPATRCAFDCYSQTMREERAELLEEIINNYKTSFGRYKQSARVVKGGDTVLRNFSR